VSQKRIHDIIDGNLGKDGQIIFDINIAK